MKKGMINKDMFKSLFAGFKAEANEYLDAFFGSESGQEGYKVQSVYGGVSRDIQNISQDFDKALIITPLSDKHDSSPINVKIADDFDDTLSQKVLERLKRLKTLRSRQHKQGAYTPSQEDQNHRQQKSA